MEIRRSVFIFSRHKASLMFTSSVAEPAHFYAAPAPSKKFRCGSDSDGSGSRSQSKIKQAENRKKKKNKKSKSCSQVLEIFFL
jgi:hypothetical protein